MLLRMFGLALVVGWLAGCSGRDSPPIDPDEPLYVLEADPAVPLALEYGESGEVRVVARDRDSRPVPDLAVTFLLEGTPKDSSVTTVTTHTDDQGVALTTVRAGYSNALFNVRASAPDAEPVFREVGVSLGGFGSIVATGIYEGDRAMDSFAATVYIDSTCDDARVVEGEPGDRWAVTADGSSEVAFEALPATSTYAIVGSARYASGATFATACLDGVVALADGVTHVDLEALDIPLGAAGEYDARVSFDVSGSSMSLADGAYAGGESVVAYTDDAGFLLDAVEDSLGPDAQADFAAYRSDANLDAELTTALDAAGHGPREALVVARDALTAELGSVTLFGALSVAPLGTAGERLSFSAEGLDFVPEGQAAETVLLADAGVDVAMTTNSTSIFDALDTSADVELVFGLSAGEVVQAGLRATAARASAPSVAAWLAEAAGCGELGQVVDTPLCDPACVAAACDAAIDDLAAAMALGADQHQPNFTDVRVSGAMGFVDADENLVAEAAVDAGFTYQLWNALSIVEVAGAFDATRAGATLAP